MNEILFEVKKSQLKMVKARGYDIREEHQIQDMSYDEFEDYLDEEIDILSQELSILAPSEKKNKIVVNEQDVLTKIYTTPDNIEPQKSILVYYSNVKTDKKDTIPSNVITDFKSKSKNHNESILITDGIVSRLNIKELEPLFDVDWQVFNVKELTYVPIEHQYSPKYQRLTDEEADVKLKELGTNRALMPIMSLNGPIAKYYNYKVGDIIKIYRDDYSIGIPAPKSINYRVVLAVSKN
ncbi:MAG: DNA-directed RNA polymerase subunit RpoH/Rpb5 C-terminal domain-containing protein [Candidatus Marithrix sp.]